MNKITFVVLFLANYALTATTVFYYLESKRLSLEIDKLLVDQKEFLTTPGIFFDKKESYEVFGK